MASLISSSLLLLWLATYKVLVLFLLEYNISITVVYVTIYVLKGCYKKFIFLSI